MTAFTREIEAKLEGIAEPLHQVQFLLRELSALEARFAASPSDAPARDCTEYDRAVSALAATGIIPDGFVGHGESGTFGHFSKCPTVGPDGYWTWRLGVGMNHKPLPFLSGMVKCEDWRTSLRRIASGSALPVEAVRSNTITEAP